MTDSQETHLEAHLQHDIDVICNKLMAMVALDEQALRNGLTALLNKDRQLAYSVILNDRHVDELETELDRLCLEFIVRHQPAAAHLRFVYSTSKVVKELERIGDYAESIARQVLQLSSLAFEFPEEKFKTIADLSVPMVRHAVKAFVERNEPLARQTMKLESQADAARNDINADLVEARHDEILPLEALSPLLTIARRFERTADQAYNICEEAIYYATGEHLKHRPMETVRILFVDDANACLSQMAEAIGTALNTERISFASAGLVAGPVDPLTIRYLKDQGIDTSHQGAKSVDHVPDLDQVQVIIALCEEAEKIFPPAPTKTVGLRWKLTDPAQFEGTPDETKAAYDEAFTYLTDHVRDLAQAILGNNQKPDQPQ